MLADGAHEIVYCKPNQMKRKNKEKTMKKRKLLSITGLLALGLTFGVNFAQAQAGSLDPTFGTGGTVTTNFGGVSLSPLTAIEQSNGNIAVVTGIGNGVPNEEDFALVRYTSNGTLIGTTRAAFFNNGINSPIAVAVQSNGNIVVAGTASPGIDQPDVFAIARFTPSGQLDTSFGNDGLVTTDISGVFPSVSAVIVQLNGQIVVGGVSGSGRRHVPPSTVLVRYNSNGSLDTTFGKGGIVQEPTAVGEPLAMARLSNGDYLAVSGNQLMPETGVVVEFSSTGVLQSTVTPAPVVASSPSTPELVNPVIFQPNGDYIWAETVGNGFQRTAVEAFRFNETGVADPSFTSIKITFGGQKVNEPLAIARQANGQIVVGGLSGLARLNSNGQLDTTFGSGGSLATFSVSGLLIQTDGKIVAVGSSGADLALARYFAN
jgi:uncharacterized delta-60 repeat protein